MGSLCPTLQKGQLRRAGARPRGRCRAARQAGPLEMPGGCLWLDSHAHNYSILYGQQFVIQRPPRGGEGLVLAPQITQLQMVQEGQTTDRRGACCRAAWAACLHRLWLAGPLLQPCLRALCTATLGAPAGKLLSGLR